ncbi:carbohydrate porin [Comamonas odontotermitis]|uniref:carbohydrate porin n=1 Tax=Comamonas odontotermitis TaxID=379895 RepID=UPI003671F0AB
MRKKPLNRWACGVTIVFANFLAHAESLSTDSPPEQIQTLTDPTKDFFHTVGNTTGLEFWGYGRGGFYSTGDGSRKGGYSLGGDLQKYRLGNEGDNYLEFGIGKRIDLSRDVKWGLFYMPMIYNGHGSTAQAYTSISGIFGNNAAFWAGQRYHRVQDIHIVDKWIIEDGDNYGIGVDEIPLGRLGYLNVAAHTADSIDNKGGNPNNARRVNLQWRDIPISRGGKLTVTGGWISGHFERGKDGGALGLMHVQKDFLIPRLNNLFIAQISNGHTSLSGKFYNLDNRIEAPSPLITPDYAHQTTHALGNPQQPGAKQRRILDSLDFQIGHFGGQTLIGYQTTQPEDGHEMRDWTVGGRVSYGINRCTKLLAEFGSTLRSLDGQPRQTLKKGTIAIAFSPSTDFWARPEVRVYATHANWNKAATYANAVSFGNNRQRRATMVGAQVEAWW